MTSITRKTQDKLPDWQAKLAKRGILDEALAADWQCESYYSEPVWIFPILDFSGAVITRRAKSLDSNARKKYIWPDGKNGAIYYHCGDLQAAIADAGGVLYIANGEPSVLVYHAAGVSNVMSWFGETSVPDTLASDLKALGVGRVIYLPDKDTAGQESAAKVRDRLADTDISYEARAWPDWLETKADANDLWQAVEFDCEAFQRIIHDAPPLDLPETKPDTMHEPFRPLQTFESGDYETDRTLGIEQIIQTLGANHFNAAGWSKNIPCPFHEDKHASAGINKDSGALNCFVCGTFKPEQLADHFSIAWPERKRRSPYQNPELAYSNNKKSVFTDALSWNSRYLDRLKLPDSGVVLIRSDIGTGKTERAKAEVNRAERALIVTHREALTKDVSERYGIEFYKDIPDGYHGIVPKLAICVNSLHKLAHGGKTPRYDVVIIDEIEQLLAHFGGDTFRGGEATDDYRVLSEIVQNARLVLAMDAHASEISRQWLTSIRGEVLTVENTYTHDRGDLTLYNQQSGAIDKLLALIDSDNGPVAIPTNSAQFAQILARLLKSLYGDDSGLLVFGENSDTAEIRHFTSHIDTELPKLRWLVYTPSYGSGLDIQTQTRALFGYFFSRPLSASECHQLLGRCRNTRETHVWVQSGESHAETGWREILNRRGRAAQGTAHLADFAAHGVETYDTDILELAKLNAMIKAERNRSMNDLRTDFTRLAADSGYTLQANDTSNSTITDMLKEERQAARDRRKHELLTLPPVDHKVFDQHRYNGTLTHEIRRGHERYIMQDTVGLELTPDNYLDLCTSRKRAAIRLFTTLGTPQDDLKTRDIAQAQEGYLLSKRSHHTAKRNLIIGAIETVFGPDGLNSREQLTEAEITERFAPWLEANRNHLYTYLNRRTDLSDRPKAIFCWLLCQIGIKLASKQRMVEGKRFYCYWIDQERATKMRYYARHRRNHLAEKRHQREILKTREDKYMIHRVLSNHHAPTLSEAEKGGMTTGERATKYLKLIM